jgi:NAD+ diphosphatase
LIGVYPFEEMSQVIIGYHIRAKGTIKLNEELDSFILVTPEECVVWPTGTGYALRNWLHSKGYEPEMMKVPKKVLVDK